MTDTNDPTTTFLRALNATATEAVSGGLHPQLVLKGGEVLEGVPERVRADASGRPPAGPLPPEERAMYVDRVEVSVELAGTEVLLQ